jgi:hypothetical protein
VKGLSDRHSLKIRAAPFAHALFLAFKSKINSTVILIPQQEAEFVSILRALSLASPSTGVVAFSHQQAG